MSEEKDLTYSKNQRKTKMKEVIRPDGTRQKVPFAFWRVDVIRDPMGATAQLAAQNKDPDLDKIRVDNIPIKSFVEAPIINIEKPDEPIQPPIVSMPLISNLDKDTAKRMGFRSAEHGKNRGKEA
jgi:hypothetical protein